MKNILIVGKNSYIGRAFSNWISNFKNYKIEVISLREINWKELDYSKYDCILYLSAIVHKKENKKLEKSYFEINTQTPFEIAKIAKKEKVKQFIYLSTMNVYGLNTGIISKKTKESPKSMYGKSKLLAENYLKNIDSKDFKVAIVRAPMVYGLNCKGNFTRLVFLAKKVPFFLKVNNQRSMIFIENLSEFLRLLIDSKENGCYFPQNKNYINTYDMVSKIKTLYKIKFLSFKLPNFFVYLLTKYSNLFSKLFGDLVYEKNLSNHFDNKYNIINYDESIEKSLYINYKVN